MCQRVRELLLAMQAGAEIPISQQQQVREHLWTCRSCASWLIEQNPIMAISLSLRQRGFEDEQFVGEVMAGLHQRRSEEALVGSRLNKLWKVAAALVLLSLLSLAYPHHRQKTTLAEMWQESPAGATEPFVEVEGEGVKVFHLTTGNDGEVQVAFIVSPAVEL